MLLGILIAQTLSAKAILNDSWSKVQSARSITVTRIKTTEEVHREARIDYSFRTGGYFRAQAGPRVDLSSPKQAWTYQTDKKIYQSRNPVPTNFSLPLAIGLDVVHVQWSIIGDPKAMKWHGKDTLRIELDGRKALTKETKFYVFVDPRSHLPVGISANLGSITQVTIFENLKINPPLKDKVFQFTPPKGWKRVTATTGGWK